MAKRFPVHRIKSHRVYTIWEVADLLGCHKRSVARWIKLEGLAADTGRKPFLIAGRDLKAFLGARQHRTKCKLALHHCYCLRCQGPREPFGKMADYTQQTPATGRLSALCPDCEGIMHKIIRRADLEAIQAKLEVTVQKANPRIVSQTEPNSNVTFHRSGQPHGKAQTG